MNQTDLSMSQVIFSSQQTYELMHCLEEIHIAEKLQPQPKQVYIRMSLIVLLPLLAIRYMKN